MPETADAPRSLAGGVLESAVLAQGWARQNHARAAVLDRRRRICGPRPFLLQEAIDHGDLRRST
eukprot:10023946-Alexandrium_andersonii.AAC.1